MYDREWLIINDKLIGKPWRIGTPSKGPWALYYLQIEPGGNSLLAGGIWCPDKNQLATIRNAIMRNPRPLRDVINNEEFIEMFGKPLGKSGTINGVDKLIRDDVDLLKLKSIAATKPFTDKVVMSSSFVDEIIKAVKVLSPLVQCINEMILPQSDDEEEG
ncbi:hypothetical protein H4Q26_012148 [Puccinia striiformis f. sp. tritici PST-130]|nr:hypothetical protein H4Q26_012148 [Puccinia striiformis f. sp. tritici PST-130]